MDVAISKVLGSSLHSWQWQFMRASKSVHILKPGQRVRLLPPCSVTLRYNRWNPGRTQLFADIRSALLGYVMFFTWYLKLFSNLNWSVIWTCESYTNISSSLEEWGNAHFEFLMSHCKLANLSRKRTWVDWFWTLGKAVELLTRDVFVDDFPDFHMLHNVHCYQVLWPQPLQRGRIKRANWALHLWAKVVECIFGFMNFWTLG